MKWRQPADRTVIEAVLATFRAPATTTVRDSLARLSLRQWQRSYHWMDSSGMALYFLARLEALNITDSIPAPVLARFRTNLADSHHRVLDMLAEFTALNGIFTDSGIAYANLKGFTLAPDSCPALELRCQLDFDFLIDGAHIHLCRSLLEARGYTVRGTGPNVLEFKSNCGTLADIADLYRPKPQRSVEIHFSCDAEGAPSRDPRLDRLRTLTINGTAVPALSSVDQFVGQATHLFGHLCGACTRVAWLFEFANHMRAHANDTAFWNEVREAACQNTKTAIALGLCTQLAAELFAPGFLESDIPPALGEWMLARTPPGIAAWATMYGRRALLADTPGTKLGLLLKEQFHRTDPNWSKQKCSALIPRARAPRLLPVSREDGWRKRLHSESLQLRYDLFRLRFHLVEGARFLYESFRWRRTLAQQAATTPTDTPYTALSKSRL